MTEKAIEIPALIKSDKVALKYWNEAVPALEKSGTVSPEDLAVLTNYCLAYAKAMRYEYFLREKGDTITVGKRGYTQVRPGVAICREAWKDVRTCADRLGLSPAARKKINVDIGDDEDDFFN